MANELRIGDTVVCNVTIAGASITKATSYVIKDINYFADSTIPLDGSVATTQWTGLKLLTITNDAGAVTIVPSTLFMTGNPSR